ncbi:MAG TPA: LLM class flavin-dependent oxidoreductase [Acetobacteraceae bacterium]|nr:LLM class flavin-dependent oxidoreductase [Acetobacteraceae bacterium]
MPALSPVSEDRSRRHLLKYAAAMAGSAPLGLSAVRAATTGAVPSPQATKPAKVGGGLGKGLIGYMLAHEQFPVQQLVSLGSQATQGGFHLLATSDHLQPWQANEARSGEAWVTMGALSMHVHQAWMGTTVTCPILRYSPAVVAEAFASLSHLAPGRIFLGVGSGEALNEQAATGMWPKWQERWDRLIEAIDIIRGLWSGEALSHKSKYYKVDAKLFDPPPQPIPLLTAANGRKSMRLAGRYGDGLVTDPLTWQQNKAEWQDGARAAGKNPDDMPVLVEQYVVVGGDADARKAAELWRFGPKAFKSLYNVSDPAEIQRRADARTPLDEVMKGWPISTDPGPHIQKIHELQESGVSIVNIHAGQPDPQRVIDFYATRVLPHVAQPASSGGSGGQVTGSRL